LLTPRVENASMEFDLNTLSPTYKLIMGVPGSSNALAIASKLGMRSDVINLAKQNVTDENSAFEQALANAEKIRKQYEAQLEQLEADRKVLQKELAQAETLNGSLQNERNKLLAGSREEAQRIVAKAREQANDLIAEIKNILAQDEISDRALFAARGISKQIAEIQIQQEEEQDEIIFTGDPVDFAKLKVGDLVYSKKMNVQVRVVDIKSPSRIRVKVGGISTEVKVDDLFVAVVEANKNSKNRTRKPSQTKSTINTRSVKNEINVIGKTVDEAIVIVDAFIDTAVLSGLSTVWVIHGMGTGKLRAGLHAHFKRHANVAEFRLGVYGEGESGVTCLTLK